MLAIRRHTIVKYEKMSSLFLYELNLGTDQPATAFGDVLRRESATYTQFN